MLVCPRRFPSRDSGHDENTAARPRPNAAGVSPRTRTAGWPALHELQGRAGILPAPVGNADGREPLALARSRGRLEACPTLGPHRFMVPMRA